MPNFYEYNNKRFKNAFWRPSGWFKQWGDTYDIPGRSGDLLVHQDNGKDVLIVCHTDYITPMMPYSEAQARYVQSHPNDFPDDKIFTAPFLKQRQLQRLESDWVTKSAKQLDGPVVDDRLGCAIALGCSDWADLLFTDCEEIGKSTAAHFVPPRDYNWIVELDRKGTDAVTYQYNDLEWMKALRKHFTIGNGSFSDIGYMEGLGTSAVNIGVGYHNEHTRQAYWDPKETALQLGRLKGFLEEFGDTKFTHTPAKIPNWRVNRHNHGAWNGRANGIASANHIELNSPLWNKDKQDRGIEVSRFGHLEWNDKFGQYMSPRNDWEDELSEEVEAAMAMDWLYINYPDQYQIIIDLGAEEIHQKALNEYSGEPY